MPVSSTASSIAANEARRASNRLRTRPFTSARVVASTTHAAYRTSSPRLPATTTQLADASSGTPYASQNAAVSARSGSISPTRAWSTDPITPATAGASRSSRSSAGTEGRPGNGSLPAWVMGSSCPNLRSAAEEDTT